ncbi:two-component system response regulator [Thioclava sp. SK-1]|uniref:ANTAR domain-containing response regulator n=1 Tax=Thioclava sp. SK-1 TaxID=1889770 RepID=UPI000825EA81|nr:ANTAR domain-containing protein [Thioclava sp. SK-1]OCX65291.1 two-component system response regulator [Thioclava sp. SK-1]
MNLHIVVVEKDPERAQMIEEGLRGAGASEVTIISQDRGLARKIADCHPDMVLIALESPSRDYLEELTLATGPMDRPVAMFVDKSESNMTEAAISAGVSAYVVDGLRQERIKPILEAAIVRFQMVQKMRAELSATRRALEERKVIDRAKGLLMRARNIDEEEAYGLLRKTAMAQGKKMADVAQALVTASELLK